MQEQTHTSTMDTIIFVVALAASLQLDTVEIDTTPRREGVFYHGQWHRALETRRQDGRLLIKTVRFYKDNTAGGRIFHEANPDVVLREFGTWYISPDVLIYQRGNQPTKVCTRKK